MHILSAHKDIFHKDNKVDRLKSVNVVPTIAGVRHLSDKWNFTGGELFEKLSSIKYCWRGALGNKRR